MATEPVTDNERDALGSLAEAAQAASPGPWYYDGRDILHRANDPWDGEPTHIIRVVVPLPETWHESQRVPDAVAKFIAACSPPVVLRLVAALSAATTERDGACEWPRGACAHWNGEYTGLGERLHTAEQRAEALAAQLQQAREALREIVGVCTYPRDAMRSRVNDCIERGERVLSIASSASAAAAPATTLNEPDGKSGTMADARHERLPSGSLSAAAAAVPNEAEEA